MVKVVHVLTLSFAPYDTDVRRALITLICFVFLFPASASAQLIPAPGGLPACDFRGGEIHFACVPIYIGYLIQILLGFAGGFFLFGIMLGGYKYMFGSLTGQADSGGKKEIVARIIGFVVVLFSYILVDTIIQLLT